MAKLLSDMSPMYEGQKKEISSKGEHGRKHIALNKHEKFVKQFKIDKDNCSDRDRQNARRCDYLLLNDTDLNAYFIELKGGDITHAISQVEATIKELTNQLKEYKPISRIVSKRVPSTISSDAHKWMEPRKGERRINVNGKPIKPRYIKSGNEFEEEI